MVKKIRPTEYDVTLRFGGGLHTRASEDQIDDMEAADGQNFLLDLENNELRNRPPFDLIGTVPNAGEIRGGGSLLKADGTVSTLIQADDTVYEWDGVTTFTSKGSVVSTAKLRGHWRSHNWVLGDKLILTDLNLSDTVKEWDGTTFATTTFTDENAASFGDYKAKYCSISNERAIFSNSIDPGATVPHIIVGSARGDYTQITITDRPSSSLGAGDPFFLLAPDLKPINGLVEAFGTAVVSTEKGQIFNLTGSDATDFAFQDFYPGSGASGDESVVYIGNDVIYGRQGRIESIRDTDRFGDAETDDLTVPILDTVEGYTGWTSVYNSRLNRVYLFPSGVSECWVFQTSMKGGKLSPWMKWTTAHAMGFTPTFAMSMLDPADGLEYVFMGDASGNFYRMEGSGTSGDSGSASITTEWLSKLISAPLDAEVFEIEGWIKYRKNQAATVTLKFEYAGFGAANETITVTIPEITGRPLYGGSIYYNDGNYYGTSFEGRLTRQHIMPAGQGNEFQLRVSVTGTTDIEINEIGLRLRAASS